ncbi:substrate-binding domain-containing protein, partial [Rhizobium brockwellii]
LQALRALTELQQAGINIPADVSVTGFDDLIWSPVVTPALTTVRMDMDKIAGIAVSALVDSIRTSSIRKGMLVTAEIERVA